MQTRQSSAPQIGWQVPFPSQAWQLSQVDLQVPLPESQVRQLSASHGLLRHTAPQICSGAQQVSATQLSPATQQVPLQQTSSVPQVVPSLEVSATQLPLPSHFWQMSQVVAQTPFVESHVRQLFASHGVVRQTVPQTFALSQHAPSTQVWSDPQQCALVPVPQTLLLSQQPALPSDVWMQVWPVLPPQVTHWPVFSSQLSHLVGSHGAARQVEPQTFALAQQPSARQVVPAVQQAVPLQTSSLGQQEPLLPSVPGMQVCPVLPSQTTQVCVVVSQVWHWLALQSVSVQQPSLAMHVPLQHFWSLPQQVALSPLPQTLPLAQHASPMH